MKTFNNIAAQGDLLIRRVDSIPETATRIEPQGGKHIVAHSETGHHHLMTAADVEYFQDPENSLVCYLRIEAPHADLIHNRSFDTHETLRVPAGLFELRRQREHTPDGWRRVED